MKKILDNIAKILRGACGAIFLGIIAVTTIQIVCRSILKIGSPWTEEVAKYMLIWLTFLGAPVLLHMNEHLMVDILYIKFSPKVRQIVHLINDVIILIFSGYLFYFGIMLCMNPSVLKFVSPAAGIPRVCIYSALPVGAFFLLLFVIYDIYNTILIIQGKAEDTTGGNMVDESKTLAEIDAEKKGAAK